MAENDEDCMKEENLSEETCNMNVLQCFMLKTKTKAGKITVERYSYTIETRYFNVEYSRYNNLSSSL